MYMVIWILNHLLTSMITGGHIGKSIVNIGLKISLNGKTTELNYLNGCESPIHGDMNHRTKWMFFS